MANQQSAVMTRTLPDHEWCTAHRNHKLGCAQYERMIDRCSNHCEICHVPAALNTRGKLAIDHRGHDWAVRGLLCNTCNTRLTSRREGQSWAAEYLANSWWIKECERLGVTTTLMPEPAAIGSIICDQWDTYWFREHDGLWRPHGFGRPGISSLSWPRFYETRGPQNMAPVDPRAPETPTWVAFTVDSVIRDAERRLGACS